MERQEIAFKDFRFDPALIKDRWMLLTGGEFSPGAFNSMTVSWGSVGHLWNKPFFQIVVRPSRYTMEFIEKGDSFTLCILPETQREALNLLGSKSGRDGDKIAASGLHPQASRIVVAPCYEEAELVAECRKMYWQDIDPSHFLLPDIMSNYPKKDFHRVYFGEILSIHGIEVYRNTGKS